MHLRNSIILLLKNKLSFLPTVAQAGRTSEESDSSNADRNETLIFTELILFFSSWYLFPNSLFLSILKHVCTKAVDGVSKGGKTTAQRQLSI
jgi:hypothetical protein